MKMSAEQDKVTIEKLNGIAKDQSDEYRLLYEYSDHQVIASFGDYLYGDAKNVRLIAPDGRTSDFQLPEKSKNDETSGRQNPDWGKITSLGNHMYIHDMNVTLLGPDGSLAVVPLHEKPENLPESFAWARESFGKLTAEWDKIAAGEERSLLDNFRQRGGLLSLMQRNADERKVSNALTGNASETRDDTYADSEETVVTGAALQNDDEERLGDHFDFFISLSTDREPTVLLHELTHCADHGISESPIFKECYLLDWGRGSQYTQELSEKMKKFEECGGYSGRRVINELICRLNEERHKDPERFKKECPLLDEFYAKIFYPTLAAQTAAVNPGERFGSKEALEVLKDDELLSDVTKGPDDQDFEKVRNLYGELQAETDPEKKIAIQQSLAQAVDQTAYVQSLRRAMDEFQKNMVALQHQTKFAHREEVWDKQGLLCGPDGMNYWVPMTDKGHFVVPGRIMDKYLDSNGSSNNNDGLRMDGARGAAFFQEGVGSKEHISNGNMLATAANGGLGMNVNASKPEEAKQIQPQTGIDARLVSKRGQSL